MERSERDTRVPWLGVVIAFLVPLVVAGLAAVLVGAAGPHHVRLIGVPRDELRSLEAASEGEALVSAEEAVEVARGNMHGVLDGRVRDFALGRYTDEAYDHVRGRLVWVISFSPDERAPVFKSGPIGADHSCDWAFHYVYAVAGVDADTGEWLWSGNGAFFDPSLPPTYDSPTNSDLEYCERLYGGQ